MTRDSSRMSKMHGSTAAKRGLKLVVVNDAPRRPSDEPLAPLAFKSRKKRFDSRFVDLAALVFAISLAVLLAHVFGAADAADKSLLCFMAGGTTCL